MSNSNHIVNGDGYKDITLARPIKIDGATVKTVRMREPTVADQLAHDEYPGGPAAKEIAVMANLCMISPDDLKGMALRDYKRLQEAYLGFTD